MDPITAQLVNKRLWSSHRRETIFEHTEASGNYQLTNNPRVQLNKSGGGRITHRQVNTQTDTQAHGSSDTSEKRGWVVQ
jgi:hypothetical protein